MTTEHIYIEPLTPEEDTELRLRGLEEQDYGILRALRSKGARTAARGYDHVLINPDVLGFEAPPVDAEHRELSLPRVSRRGVYLPATGRTLTLREVCDRWMKTKEKRREFALGCTRAPALTSYIAVEAGAEYERRAIATAATAKLAEELALKKVGVKPDEPLRAVLVECRDDKLATEIVETRRDELPWAEVELRPDGELPVGWHNCKLTRSEKERLEEQASRDRRAKRDRRDRVIRSMQREPI